MKKNKVVPEFPPRRNPPGHVPHVIDWEKAKEVIGNLSEQERRMLIEASRGDYEGVDDGYYD